MLGFFVFLFGYAPLALAFPATPVSLQSYCDRFEIEPALDPPLSELEERLVCGDHEAPIDELEGWRDIPEAQAEATLRSFLKDRGYYFPKVDREKNHVRISLGPVTQARTWKIDGVDTDEVLPQKNRAVIGQPLTPRLLRAVDKWVLQSLQKRGFPCPRVRSEADPETGLIVTHVRSAKKLPLKRWDRDTDLGLDPRALERYSAFQLDQSYRGDLVTLTELRILRDNQLQTLRLYPECSNDDVVLKSEGVSGRPRQIRIGFGISSESIVIGKASWRATRLDSAGTWVEVAGRASFLSQDLSAVLNWYPSLQHPRWFILPDLHLYHEELSPYQDNTLITRALGGTTWEPTEHFLALSMGPQAETIQLLGGPGPTWTHLNSWTVSLLHHGQDYELYARDPRQGLEHEVALTASTPQGAATPLRLSYRGHLFFNPGGWDPPQSVVGLRWRFYTVSGAALPTLPAPLLAYLGGSATLRGFGLQELPSTGVGGLSSAQASIELRLSKFSYQFKVLRVFTQRIEPIAFVDFGLIGTDAFALSPPLYWSPGIGIRVASSIGPIRFTVARGFPSDAPGHMQFYFSLGQEF